MRRPIPIWVYSIPAFNRLVDLYFRHRLTGALAIDPLPWRHPWYTTVRWDEASASWLATVKPGACPSATSDGDPVVICDQIVAPVETIERLDLDPGGREKNLRAYLSEGAPVALRPSIFRPIGTDATGTEAIPAEAVPPYFAKRDVMGASVLRDQDGAAALAVSGLEADRRRARLLRACDLILSCDRIATTAQARESDLAPGTLALEFGPSRPPGYDPDPRLSAVSKWESPADLAALDLALGTGTDRGRDEIHLATVYLLSQPGEEPGSDPVGSRWTPYVDHHVQWPLQYATRFDLETVGATRIETPIPILGAGELGRWGAAMTSEINGRVAELETALAQVRNEGRFLML